MAPMTSTDGDVLQNKLNMLFASRQRLLETWLPPRGAEELANAKSTDELEREEEAIFRPIPTTVGIGAPIPEDFAEGRRHTSDDRLRKRLLGKSSSSSERGHRSSKIGRPVDKQPRISTALNQTPDDDDEPGRSSLGRSKRKPSAVQHEGNDGSSGGELVSMSNQSNKRTSNFLDVMLSKRSQKRQRGTLEEPTRNEARV